MKTISILLGLITIFTLTKCDPTCDSYHTIIEGEDCESIRKIEKTSILELTSANPGIDCENLAVGTKLCIKSFFEIDPNDNDDDEMEEEEEFLEKRATPTCINKNKVKIGIQYNYMNGCPYYTIKKTSAKTALNNVNGCSMQELIDLGATINLLDSRSKSLFTPACNTHDVCYGCQIKKSTCDKNFHTNMKNLCGKAYKTTSKDYDKCIKDAKVFYTAVSVFAGGPYKNAKKIAKNYDLSDNCGFCGATLVKNAIKSPYYLYKGK